MVYGNDIDNNLPDFDEASSSQIPAILQLINLGYEFIADPRSDKSQYILRDIAFAAMRKINKSEISDRSIQEAIVSLEKIKMDDGTFKASEDIFADLLGGIAVSEMIDGKKTSPQMRLVDWSNPQNNSFHVIAEFEISESRERRPDIVLFVNGIPLAVIENKKASVPVDEAVLQMIRNQQLGQTPKFFLFPQLLVCANVDAVKYGTMLTPREFYAVWKEKNVPADFESLVLASVNKVVPAETIKLLLSSLRVKREFVQFKRFELTAQDKAIYSLLRPKRLLDLTRNFILYDNGVKKITRYQQFFAIKKTLKRIEEFDGNGKRCGGLIWHTQGSGKSLTMVMLVKNLIETIQNPRVIVVTDRTDLDVQIRDTFKACNIKAGVQQAVSSKDLIRRIRSKTTDVITTLVHKFEKETDFRDDDNNIFILIDEAHRTQGGDANAMMNRILPRACQIAFTGTPLMKKDKSKNKFGGFIDTYTISEAEEDGAILPLIYQGRFVDQRVDENINLFYERIAGTLSEQQKKDFEKKCLSSSLLEQTSRRVEMIALDVHDHYVKHFQGTGLKAQLVAPSKYAAILFKKALDMLGDVSSEVVISETVAEEDESDDKNAYSKKTVAQFLAEQKTGYGSLENREKRVIQDFKKNPEGCEILIVVDKLLTGFDAPCNTVLYLAKQLQDHNLLQAIARVNRLYDGEKDKQIKANGLIVDYSKNAKNLKDALALFSHYEAQDVERALLNTDDQIQLLEKTYDDLHAIFKNVKDVANSDAYVQELVQNEDAKNKFYEKVNLFIRQFDTCFSLYDFHKKFSDEKLKLYRKDLKRFVEIKKTTQLVLAEKVDFSKYKEQLRKLLDTYVSAKEVEILSKEISLTDMREFNQYVEDEKNGLSDRSKAKAIAAQTSKVIRERYKRDEIFYKKFSDRIEKILQEIEDAKREDVTALFIEMKKIQSTVENYEDSDLPEVIRNEKVYHPFWRNLAEKFANKIDDNLFVEVLKQIIAIIRQNKKVDFEHDITVKRRVIIAIEDFLFDDLALGFRPAEVQAIAEKCWELAILNREMI